jgi:hypothetical protein
MQHAPLRREVASARRAPASVPSQSRAAHRRRAGAADGADEATLDIGQADVIPPSIATDLRPMRVIKIASSRPKPLPPPVMTAIRPLNSFMTKEPSCKPALHRPCKSNLVRAHQLLSGSETS